MRIGFVEWPESLLAESEQWREIADIVSKADIDILVTNELPFGPWIAAAADFDSDIAERSIECHRRGLEGLKQLGVPAIISSRPVWEGDRLANEAFSLERGEIRSLHRKQYFPSEKGWYEASWYATKSRDFTPEIVGGVKVGVLLCTELMFNEHAREYRKQGAQLIVAPRATGKAVDVFRTAGAMAAIVSGCFVVSSNRVGEMRGGPVFGGKGFACAPNGSQIAMTSPEEPLAFFDLDLAIVNARQEGYPCYVQERS